MTRRLTRLFAGLVLAFAAVGAHAEIGVSIQLQQDQIASDARTGMLKPSEVQIVTDNLNRIKFEHKRAKSDGVINHYETQMLNRMLLENANAIIRFRQNRLKR